MRSGFAGVLLAAAILLACRQAEAQIVVIGNPSIKASEVSRADLRDAFTGVSTTLKDGSRVTPVLLKEGSVNSMFLSLYIDKSEAAFRANWRSLLFSGQGSLPRTFDSEAAVVEYVARTPGTIGYVVNGTPHEAVKVIAVR